MTKMSAFPISGAVRRRVAVAMFFFLQGLCFSSWTSRIPTVQDVLGLSESTLGLILFVLPVGQILSTPFIGWFISRFGSRNVLLSSIVSQAFILCGIGFVHTILQLGACLLAFGFAMNSSNISVNAKAVEVEILYQKSIMASFHGFWSLAGFAGASIGTVMIAQHIAPHLHFLLIMMIVFCAVATTYTSIPREGPRLPSKEPLFVIPDRSLVMLGMIAFCSMICEGTMFDWSGVYFKKVLHARDGWIGAGYTAFMSTMATSRFFVDRLVRRFGFEHILKFSGALTSVGLLIAVCFPTIPTGIVGFLMVGAGVAGIVPLVFSAAGRSKTLSPGRALTAVSTIGFLGFLVGPPLIGLVAGATNLRVSFSIIAMMAICISFVKTKN